MSGELKLSNCSAQLGGRTVLQDISFSLPCPGLHCVIGSNGAGKTTLLRLICGLLEHAGGEIELEGRTLSKLNGRERAALISYVPQLADNGIGLRLHESLEIARAANPAGRTDVGGVIRRLNLQDFEERLLTELSGGELKRALIAQALAQDTRVMLLDEPTAHLDPPARLEIMQLLRAITREEGRLVLASLHYPELAREYADSVLLLRTGRLLEHGAAFAMTDPLRLEELYGPLPATLETT